MLNQGILNIKIDETSVDICPLCQKRFSLESNVVKVKQKRKLLFFAHKECIDIFDTFISNLVGR